MKKLLLSTIITLAVIAGFGQTKVDPQTGVSFTLDQSHEPEESYDYKASEFVKLTGTNDSQFGYNPNSGQSFHAVTDPLLVVPPEINTTIGPPGNNNGGIVGSINGSFSVSAGGGATYDIPFEFPSGVNGHAPNLSLAYSSTGGDGLICDGWSLQGIPVISRYPKTYYYNDTSQTVVFSNYDEFVLNGQHLIKINDNEYRTENESFNKIVPIEGDVNNGFILYHGNGMITKFGSGQNSRHILQEFPFPVAWYADTIFDPFKNYISIEYHNNTTLGYLCPKYIKYTGNSVKGTNPFYRIELHYEERTDTPKKYFYYESPYNGLFSKQDKRLASISCVYLPTMEAITEYQLNYQQAGIFSKYFLSSVTRYGSDGYYYNPTIFEWKHNGYDVGLLCSDFIYFEEGANETSSYFSSDFNRDGTDDLIHYWRNMDYLIDSFCIHMGDDYQGYYSINAEFSYKFIFPVVSFQTGDFNGDGINDIFYVYLQNNKYKSKIMFMEYDESSNSFTYTDMDVMNPLSASAFLSPTFVLDDFTGNGITDCAVMYEPSGASYTNLFFFTGTVVDPLSVFVSDGSNQTYECEHFFARDFDGDHKTDLMIITESNAKVFKLTLNNQMITSYNCTNNFVNIYGKIASGDFNNDGKSDIIIINYDSKENIKLYHSYGEGFANAETQTIEDLLSGGFNIPQVLDLNGDGFDDLAIIKVVSGMLLRVDLFTKPDGKSFITGGSSHLLYIGNSIINQDFFAFTWCENYNSTMVDMVFTYFDIETLDNYGVRVFADETNCNYNVITKITNGFGEETNIFYEQIDNYSSYSKGKEEPSPIWMINRGMSIVTQYEKESGNNTFYQTEIKYKGAKYHRFGKGFLGFDEVTFQNESNGRTTTTYYSHNNPFYHVQIDSIKNWLTSSGALLDRIKNIYHFHDLGNKRFYQYLSATVNEKFELDGQLSDYSVQTNTHHLNSQGLLYRIEENFQKSIDDEWVNKYSNISLKNLISGAKWVLGLKDTIRTTHTSYNDDPIQRVTVKEYFAQNGAVKKTIIEPDNPKKKETTYLYDDYGNNTETALLTTGLSDRITTKTYTNDGRFIDSLINAMGHVTQYQFYPKTGLLQTEIDPNQKATTFFYDGFGRKITTVYPDGIRTETRLLWADHPDMPLWSCYYKWAKTSDSPESIVFYDNLNREMRTVTTGFDGQKIYIDKQYYLFGNHKGLVRSVSNPYFASYPTKPQTFYTTYTYDELRRKSTVTAPDGVVTIYNYSKKQVTTTTVAGNETRIKRKKLDAAGRLVCSQDMVNNISVINSYYSNGLLKETWTGGDENSKISNFYDTFGNLDTIIDPNMGMIVKTYNQFGEVISETDANNNTTIFAYDQLGRLVNRSEDDAITTWQYDTQDFGIGKLHYTTCNFTDESSNITISTDEYFYDSYGRQIRNEKTINGQTFVTQTTRDVFGRVKQTIYPSGYTIKNHYNNYGYLGRISGPDAVTLWEANQLNSVGKIEEMTMGGIIHTNYTYQLDNFRITSIESGKNSVNDLQNIHYQWFGIGNLDYRQDQNKDITESFIYDDLDRLRYSYINSNQQLEQQYYDNGNISFKNDVGTYQYDPSGAKPNTVTSINDPVPEMLDLPDQLVNYTSFSKAAHISQGDYIIDIAYGSNHNRVLQRVVDGVGNTSTKTYAGGLYEKIENSDGTAKELQYLSSPIGIFAIVSTDENGNESIHYLLKDHLGSITGVLDKNGNTVEELNYDAWGRRRNPQDWSYNNVQEIFLFDRGYTGHEHLDDIGLINMNGRIFDPLVARFLSPDPIIQDTENSQNYNGYSYCLNNPMKYTDPSGYSFWSTLGLSIDRSLYSLVNILTIPARLPSTIGSPGYFNLDYILHGTIPGPGSPYYFYMPVQGSDFRYTFWPLESNFYRGNDGREMGGGSHWGFQYMMAIAVEIKEEGDYNNMDILALIDYNIGIETPGLNYHPTDNETGDETEEEKKAKDGGVVDEANVIVPTTPILPFTIGRSVAISSPFLIFASLPFVLSGDSRIDQTKLVYTYEHPSQNPIHQNLNNGSGGGPDTFIKWLIGGSFAGGTAYFKHRYDQHMREHCKPIQDNTFIPTPVLPIIEPIKDNMYEK